MPMTSRLSLAGASLLLALGATLFSACGQTESAVQKLAELSHGCLVNSDCAAPLVCAFQRCHAECVTTRDCDGTLRCVGAKEAARVCQLEDESKCQTSADCAPTFVCGSDGSCRDRCTTDAECIGEQVCTAGVCAEPSELDESGKLPQTLAHVSCRLNSDCAEGQQCVGGACVDQCRDDRDCAVGDRCVEGACRDGGEVCTGERCACACREDVDCEGGEVCDGCACQPGPEPECESALDCGDGKRCVRGSCACACREARDCADGLTCDGCACRTSEPSERVIHDATLRSARDVALMAHVTEVETELRISGLGSTSTAGLEKLHTVGQLTLEDASSLAWLAREDAGLSGLRLIKGDLRLLGLNSLAELGLSPDLRVEGNVILWGTQLSCPQIGVFEDTLRANGFDGTFESQYNGECMGQCVAGVCDPN